ncbi:hypothetical protein CYLTODRAFT_419293 [Cylindrobasidium torrendii FP15055 ss-10]|uniref:TPR-like protein n=1 Tax=Cylindrobasidium torrendii FP15055 ss-10 TaxID=1314674 RepID=A0A0D7BL76_9AGAR|nr:hypothetical protein CYLTODRAFT_419293 [Cylindrobasidium torrendii FP15055 ss-10]
MLKSTCPSSILRNRISCNTRSSKQARHLHSGRPSSSQVIRKNPQDVFRAPLGKSVGVVGRTLRISALLIGISLGSVYVGFEAYDQYIEHVELAPPVHDPEAEKWEWDSEQTHWNGDSRKGGTDPGLGRKARHLVRAASTAHTTPNFVADPMANGPFAALQNPNMAVNAGYLQASGILEKAIALAEPREAAGKLHPETFTLLLTRHASYLEKLGPVAFSRAKARYEQLWERNGSAFAAWRLGELDIKTGNKDGALQWLTRAIQRAQGTEDAQIASLPPSPSNQRVLASALVSLSTFYASNARLAEAAALQTTTLKLLPPQAEASASFPETLHYSTLAQRASVLSLQHAEVLFAQGKKPEQCIRWLESAAESSTTIVRLLAQNDSLVLSPPYAESPYLQKSAQELFRDARRTVSEAWHLMGILKEQAKNQKPSDILSCYEEAMKWVGKVDENGNVMPDVVKKADWQHLISRRDRLAKKLVTSPEGSEPATQRKRWFGF